MATQEFPALGFDPAPGEPATVTAAAQSVQRCASCLGQDASTLRSLDSSTWVGEAADAFRSDLADLPRDLDHSARAHSETARALSEYATALGGMQQRARDLERRAEELKRQQAAAVTEVNRIAAIRLPSDHPRLADLRSQYSAARGRAETAGSELAQVIAAARHLRQSARDAAGSSARRVRGASDAPYEEPAWYQKAWDGVTNWIRDNADVLKQISTVLKGVAAVTGLLSLVPGLQWLAPVALVAGGAALAIDVVVKLTTGKGSWGEIAFDAVTMLPFGRLLKAGKGLVAGERAVAAGERAIGATDDVARVGDDVIRAGDIVVRSGDDTLRGGDDLIRTADEAGSSRRIVRDDNNFLAEANERGIRKSHLAEDGSLVPANPHGTTTVTEHVQGGLNPAKKGDSPYTSFSPEGHTGKVYGDNRVAIEVDRPQGDIAGGRGAGEPRVAGRAPLSRQLPRGRARPRRRPDVPGRTR